MEVIFMKTKLLQRDSFYGPAMARRRVAAGLSIREVSRRTGVSVSRISDYEHRKHFPTLNNFIKIENCIRAEIEKREREAEKYEL